jgi:hypothetical protein
MSRKRRDRAAARERRSHPSKATRPRRASPNGTRVFASCPLCFSFSTTFHPIKPVSADNHDLRDLISHDGFETTATPEPLAIGSRSMLIRRMEQSDLAASRRPLRVDLKRPGRRGAADQRW